MTTEQIDTIRQAVKSRMSSILDLTDRTKRLNKDIDDGDTHPFCLALFGREKMFNAKLITSLQTTLGMTFYEQISKTMGEIAGYEVVNQYKLKGHIDKEAKEYLDGLLEDVKYQPNRHNEQVALVEIFKKNHPSSSTIDSRNFIEIPDSTVDVFIKKPDGTEIFIDITTVKCNKKSFRTLKEKILKWFYLRLSRGDIEPDKIKTYFAIPYNPESPDSDVYHRFSTYYDREDLLVGNQLWQLVSGDQFTLKDLQNIFLEIAKEQIQS